MSRNMLVTISYVSPNFQIPDLSEYAADGCAFAYAAVMKLYLVGYGHDAVDSKMYKSTWR
jgi:hypothetical protein